LKQTVDATGRLASCFALIASLIIALPTPVRADPAYQCEAGPNPAVVTACAARWEAANIRAHVAARDFGGASASCLTKTATLLDQIAAKSLATNRPLSFTGTWPCGKEPAIAKADDGALAQACPNAVWSYDNKGSSTCMPSAAAKTGATSQNGRSAQHELDAAVDFIDGKLASYGTISNTVLIAFEGPGYGSYSIVASTDTQRVSHDGCKIILTVVDTGRGTDKASKADAQNALGPPVTAYVVTSARLGGDPFVHNSTVVQSTSEDTESVIADLKHLSANVTVSTVQISQDYGHHEPFPKDYNDLIKFYLTDEDVANRVAHALSDAVKSCGGGAEAY